MRLIRSMPSQASRDEDGRVLLRSSSETDSEVTETSYDLVMLSVGMRPRALPENLASSLHVSYDEFGFGRCASDDSRVVILGAACEPMDIEEAVARAIAGAATVRKEVG